MYKLTAEGKERFATLVADVGPQTWDDDAFGVHMAFFSRTPAEVRMRILEGRRRRVEERREGLRATLARAGEQIDRYTGELHRMGLESTDREVRWLNELIATERGEPRTGTAGTPAPSSTTGTGSGTSTERSGGMSPPPATPDVGSDPSGTTS